MGEWLDAHGALLGWLGALSLLTFVGTLLLLPFVLARIPADYFVRPRPGPGSWAGRHPVLRWTLRIAKNVLGGVFLLAGIAMLLLPGQGLLTMLVGVSLIDFPGKRKLELALVRRPRILRAINWIRARTGHAPLDVPRIARREARSG